MRGQNAFDSGRKGGQSNDARIVGSRDGFPCDDAMRVNRPWRVQDSRQVRAAKVDYNHIDIRDWLRKCGVFVIDTHRLGDGFPDLVAWTAQAGAAAIFSRGMV